MCLFFHREDYLEDFADFHWIYFACEEEHEERFDLSDERPRSRDEAERRKDERVV